MKECTCNLSEAVEILQANGFGISMDILSNAMKEDRNRPMQDRAFPFGVAIKCGENSCRFTYIIYRKLLEQFIKERRRKDEG